MTDQLFDKYIRDKLRDHVSTVPDDMWKRVQREIDQPPPGSAVSSPFIPHLYWWLGTLLLMACGSAFWLLQPGNNTRSGIQGNTTVQIKPQLSNTSSTPSSSNNNSRNTASDSLNRQTSALPKIQQDTATTANNTIPGTGDGAIAGSLAAAATGNPVKPAQTASNNNTQASLQSGIAPVTTSPVNNGTTDEALPFAALNGYAPERLYELSPAGYFSLKNLLMKQGNKKLPVIQCPTIGGPSRNDLYLELYASPDYVMRSMSSRDPHSNSYLQRKDSSESMQVSFSFGARLSKSLTDHLLAKIGLQYTQVNQKFNYQQENEKRQVTVITTHTIVQSPGDTVIVRDTSSYEQIGYLKKSTVNKFRSIDIPVILSYEWGNDQWKFAANAGPIINLYSWYNGQMFDSSAGAHLVSSSQGVYKHNIGLGIYAGVSVMKTISENMEIFAEPYFRYNFSNMTQPGQPFTQKFKTAGLSLGIRYKLNGGSGQRSWR